MSSSQSLQASTISAGSQKKKVIVLGAGLAGLTAAWELDQAAHEVVIIEAQMRPGGRVLTLREGFTPGISAEAGAMSFSDSYQNLIHYMRLFEIPFEPLATSAVRSADASAIYHLHGKLIRAGTEGNVNWPFDLTDEERKLGQVGILQKYLLSVLAGVSDMSPSDTLPDWVRAHDQKTLLELAAERGASKGAQDLLRFTFWFADMRHDESAAASLLSDLYLFFRGQTAYGFPNGSDALPMAFASRLGERIHYGSEVVRIEQRSEQVEVVVRVGEMLNRLTADRVVCAIPFSVLPHIEIDPPFSPSKQEVISGLEYGYVTRVYLQVSQRFWEREGMTGGAYTDLSIGQVQEHPIFRTGMEGNRAILEAHARGDAAPALDAMTEEERLSSVLAEMEKVHPGISKYYEGGQSKSWQNDPWARGAFSKFHPGQMTGWLPRIVNPEGRIHFAGEHTSIFPATMEGAIESGIRAAWEINTM